MIHSRFLNPSFRPKLLLGLLLVLSTFGVLRGQTGEVVRVYKPCGLLQPSKMGCFIEQEVPVYRPFGSSSRKEVLRSDTDPLSTTPAFVWKRDESVWQQLLFERPERLVVSLPLESGKLLNVYLEATSTMAGSMETGEKYDGLYYSGYVLPEHGHVTGRREAAISFLQDEIVGLLFWNANSYVLGKIPECPYVRLGYGDQVMFQSTDLKRDLPFVCGTTSSLQDSDHFHNDTKGDAAETHNTTNCPQIKVLMVAHSELIQDKQTVAAVKSHVAAIFNAVQFVMALDGITVVLYDTDVLTPATDPYQQLSASDRNKTDSLIRRTSNYAANRSGNWDLLHSIFYTPGGGRGYIVPTTTFYRTVLCEGKNIRAGVSGVSPVAATQPFPTPFFDGATKVIAHELGHNLGSPHTHSCLWPGGAFENCACSPHNSMGENASFICASCPSQPLQNAHGTIMSYCPTNLMLGFGTAPGNHIRAQVQQATCLTSISVTAQITSPTTPTVSICAGGDQLFTTAPCTNCDYQWFRNNQPITGANAPTYTATTAGAYFVRTTNGACAAQSSTVTVNVIGGTVTASANPPSLNCPGNVQLCASGASTYRWNPGNLAGSCITRNLTQTSTFTVTGTTGTCTNSATVTVTVAAPPTVTASASPNPRCGPGQISLTATGATTFRWSPGNTIGSPITRSVNQTTTFTVTGTTGNCTNSATVTVQVLPAPKITASASPASICPGGSTTLTASGAQSFTWMPGNLSGSSVVVSPSQTTTYTVTGSDGNCTSTAAVTVTVITGGLNIVANNTNLPCPGPVTMTASGAQFYTWQPGGYTTATVGINLLQTTTFTVTGRQGSCTNTATLTVSVGPGIQVNATASPSSLCQAGSVNLSATGATTYRWLPGNLFGATITRNVSQTTTYTVIGTTGNCTNSATVTVTVGAGPSLSPTASPATSCPGNPVTLSAANASSYTWQPGNLSGSSVTVNPTQTTTYTVSGVQGSCTTTATVRVTVPTGDLAINASSTDLQCPGPVSLTATGATSYLWLPNNATTPGLSENLQATKTYTVIGTTGSCTNSASITVTVGPGFSVAATATPSSVCTGGRVQLTASGATTYLWRPGNVQGASISRNVNQTTTFTVTGTTGNCSASATVTVTVGSIDLTATANPPAVCPGGSTTLTATGADSYIWLPLNRNGSTLTVNPMQTTTYTLLGFANVCSGTAAVTVQVIPMDEVIANVSQHANCNQPGVIVAACSGSCNSPQGYTFSWQPGNFGPNPTGVLQVSPAQTTTYTVTMRDETTGCTRTFSDPDYTTIQVIPCNNDLDIYYPFCAGDLWKDQGGGGFHPVPTGAIVPVSGERGSAVLFDNPPGPAINNPAPKYLSVPSLPAAFDQGITISALVRFDNPSAGMHERIFEMGNGPFGDNVLFANLGGNLTVHTHNQPQPSTYFWAGTAIAGKYAWYTAVLTPRSIAIYVNGQLAGSQTYAQDIYSNVVRNQNYIARSSWFPMGSHSDLQGAMDEFRLLNRALTAAEVADLYSRPAWIEATPNPVCVGGTAQLSVIEHPRTGLFWPHNSATTDRTTAIVQLPTVFTCERTYLSGCVDVPASVSINTFTIPSSISGLAQTYSSADPAVTLTGTPAGGTFVGPGISGRTFTPSVAGIGTHVICYSGSKNGCTYTACQTVNVVPPAPCPRPSRDFYYTNITGNSYTFNWGSVPSATMYELEVMDMSTFQTRSFTIVPLNSILPIISYTVTGLNRQTMYRNRLRTVCTGGVYSPWTTQNFFVQTLRAGESPRSETLPELLAYPNPSRGPVSLQLTGCPAGSGRVMIHDLTGRQVFLQSFEAASDLESLNLDLSDLAGGVYRLHVQVEGHAFQPLRLVIAR